MAEEPGVGVRFAEAGQPVREPGVPRQELQRPEREQGPEACGERRQELAGPAEGGGGGGGEDGHPGGQKRERQEFRRQSPCVESVCGHNEKCRKVQKTVQTGSRVFRQSNCRQI